MAEQRTRSRSCTSVVDANKDLSSLRNTSIKKDYSMGRLKDDLNKCTIMLNDAVSGKMSLESKLRDMETKRKQAEYEYNQLYQLNTKHVSWKSNAATTYDCAEAVSLTDGYPCVNTCKPRRNSHCALEQLEKRGSPYERILIPYHLHALDLVDVRDVYKESWKCDICYVEHHPAETRFERDSSYPYHCYLCNYDVCQACVNRMEGAVVTDHFTYFTH